MEAKNTKYKIGEVSRILGISTDLIRYYEEKGVVSPEKDAHNRYRYYDYWDVNFLLDCVWYKKIGFGIEEIANMSRGDSYEDLEMRLGKQAEYIEDSIKYRELLLERVKDQRENLIKASRELGVCALKRSREFAYYINRHREEFDTSSELLALNKRWEKYIPFSKRFFMIDKQALLGEHDGYDFGFSILMNYAGELGVRIEDPVVKQRPRLCVHSYFESFGKNGFTARKLDFMKEYAEKNGYAVAGPAFGNLLCSIPENGDHHGYFEAWLPVKELKK